MFTMATNLHSAQLDRSKSERAGVCYFNGRAWSPPSKCIYSCLVLTT
jgi:hypothetical protein